MSNTRTTLTPDCADLAIVPIGKLGRPTKKEIVPRQSQPLLTKTDIVAEISDNMRKNKAFAIVKDLLYIHDGCCFSLITKEKLRTLITQQYRERLKQEHKVLRTVDDIAENLKRDQTVIHDEFPINENLVVFRNGTLELSTGRFRNNSPNDMANSALSFDYNKNMHHMSSIESFFQTIANDDEDLYKRIMQVVSYVVTNGIDAKAIIYLYGIGDSGKSLFLHLLASLFSNSDGNTVGRVELRDLYNRKILGELVNAKINISSDMSDEPLAPRVVSAIKSITGRDVMRFEVRYHGSFEYKPMFKLFCASNFPLRLKNHDQAFINRTVILPFKNAIPKEQQDPNLLQKMIPELPALFNRALEEYHALVESNYSWAGNYSFDEADEPVSKSNKSQSTVSNEQIIEQFIGECCEFGDEFKIRSDELKEGFSRYCEDNGYTKFSNFWNGCLNCTLSYNIKSSVAVTNAAT